MSTGGKGRRVAKRMGGKEGADPLAGLRSYVLDHPDAAISHLQRQFHLSYRRVVTCLGELESSGALERRSVARSDGRAYPARLHQIRDLSVAASGLVAKREHLVSRMRDLEVEELVLVLPVPSAARAEKRVVADKADGVVTGRVVVSAHWLLGALDERTGQAVGAVRRRVLTLPAEAGADARRVEIAVAGGRFVDKRVAVDAAWLARVVGRRRGTDDGFEVAELVCGLPDNAEAKVAAQDLAAAALGVGARVEVDARWLAALSARRGPRSMARTR